MAPVPFTLKSSHHFHPSDRDFDPNLPPAHLMSKIGWAAILINSFTYHSTRFVEATGLANKSNF